MSPATTQPEPQITVTAEVAPPAGLPAERTARWSVVAKLWEPRTIVAQTGTAEAPETAHALTMGRPYTAARKIADVVADSDSAFRAAVEAAIADRSFVGDARPEPVVIRFEEHPATAPLNAAREAILTDLGFARDEAPVPSVPSTREGDPAFVRGWSKWLGQAPARQVPYYGQTTDVTCGAVTSIMMLEAEGVASLGSDGDANQHRELALWRRATNMPACEPVGLAVATAEELTDRGVERKAPRIVMSAPDLVLLEWYADQPYELRLREQLQRDSLRRAAELGLEIERRWADTEEIRQLVAGGADVFLLIALDPLIGDPAPHWVLAHEIIGDTVLVSDPWVEQEQGESWVDTSAMPLSLEGVDLVTRWGSPAYRAIIIVE